MGAPFTGKNTYSLIKTNPKLTGNVKLVVDSKGNIYLETIDADKELSLNKYKAVKTNERRRYSSDVYTLFNEGKTPASLVYKLANNEEFLNVKNEYSKQYYTAYTQGAYPKISKEFTEQIAYFAPVWLEQNNIPELFVIFKLKEPVSVNTKDITKPYDNLIETQIYNTDYFSGNTSNYFFETILKNSTIHAVYDLGENSVIGKYLRNHVNDPNFPEAPVSIRYNQNELSTYNGISLKKSGFTNESESMFNNLFVSDRTITELDNYITNGFERNNVLCANIINMEFLFDDEDNDNYEICRYYGFFVNREVISQFFINGKDFFVKRKENFAQNKNVKTNTTINIEDKNDFNLINENGVKLFIEGLTEYNLLSDDIKGGNYYPYIKGTKNNFYDVKTDTDWSTNEIIIKQTDALLSEFKGYTDESVGVIPAEISETSGRGYVEFTITGTLQDVELRLKKVNEYSSTFSKLSCFISDASIPAGTFNSNKFSSLGTTSDIAKSLSDCINYYASLDDELGLSSIHIDNKVIIISRVQNDYANTYKWLIYSDDNHKPPITINFGDLDFISVADYNSQNRTLSTKFKGYNQLDTISFALDDGWILESTLVGGRTNGTSRIKVAIEFFDYFNTNHFLKTKDWYSRIKGVYRYIDEPTIINRRITSFNDLFKYVTVDIEEDSDIYSSIGGYVYLYDLKPNEVGLFSFYPIKQFDVDQFRSDYNKDGDGFIQRQLEYITGVKGATSLPDDLSSAITTFEESGFASIVGNIDESNNEIFKISNEYDRLKENELSQLAIAGRIIPYINKWVYDNDAKDVRENNYRLNTSFGFGFNSFSPSEYHKTADPRYFTHEWYYLQKFPPYLTDQERVETFSYFEDFLTEDDILNLDEDKFEQYFIQERVAPNMTIPRRIKYSIFANGNNTSYANTMFRGSKLIIKRRNENLTQLNYNIKNIVTFASDYFNGYKFAAVFTNNTDNPLSYKIYENKKWKTITFFIEANLDDYFLTIDAFGNRYLDRSSLYVLKDKYVDNMSSIEIADINLSGSIAPFDANQKPTWSIDGDGAYIIPGFQSLLNSSNPSFKAQILPSQNGSYNRIEINTVRGIIQIDGIVSINENSIKAKVFQYSNNGGLTYAPFNNTFLNIYPTFEQSASVIPVYYDGGYNAFTGIIRNISFGEIFDKVNNGDPAIKYISIDEDSNGDEVITENEFLIEFIKGDINAKSNYLKAEKYVTNALRGNDYRPVGSVMRSLKNTYLTPISRVKGDFTPKTKDIILYNDNHETRFTESIRENLLFKNVQFFSNYPGFALYKQLYINKVNIDNPLTVIEVSKNSQIKPVWWLINEIALDKMDSYIFRSKWDHNYYRKYVTKKRYISYPGYVEPKESPSMLASTIMNIPDVLNLEKFTSVDISTLKQKSTPSSEVVYELFRTNDNLNKVYKIKGTIFTQSKLVNQISPDLNVVFEKYVNHRFNFNDLNTFIDDARRYTISNIVPRYEVVSVQVYGKFIPISQNDIVIENKYTVQELIANGYTLLKDVIISGIKANDYDRTFEYTLPKDKNVILAFVITVKSN